MILADTSAWVEFLRATGSRTDRRMVDLVEAPGEATLVLTEIVIMELLAGERTTAKVEGLRDLLARFPVAPLQGLPDFESAAELFRGCRRNGESVRRLTDCLIAAVALRTGASVLHRDRDFDAIARCSPLRVAS